MRVSREKAAENRERIIAEASRLFRERGFDAVGVDGLMKAVGLTHGGFYGHFGSKEDLIAEATKAGLDDSARKQESQTSLRQFLAAYLSADHRDSVGQGCLMAAIGGDLARQKDAVRAPLTAYARGQLDRVAELVAGRTQAVRRRRAITALSGVIGAVVMARAVEDPVLSDEILAAVRETLGEALAPTPDRTQAEKLDRAEAKR